MARDEVVSGFGTESQHDSVCNLRPRTLTGLDVVANVDMMLAALARQHNLIILTNDQDFAGLPDLHTENWTA